MRRNDREKFLIRQAQAFEREAELQGRCAWTPLDKSDVRQLKSQAEYFRQELKHQQELP